MSSVASDQTSGADLLCNAPHCGALWNFKNRGSRRSVSFQSGEAPRKMSQRQQEEFNSKQTRLKRSLLTCLGHALVKTQLPWHVSWNAKSMKSLLNCFCVNSPLRCKNHCWAPASPLAVKTVSRQVKSVASSSLSGLDRHQLRPLGTSAARKDGSF